MMFHLLRESENDPMAVTRILVQGFAENKENDKFEKRALSLKNSSPHLKAAFSQQVKKSMKSTPHECTVNVTPVTNPTRYTKLGK